MASFNRVVIMGNLGKDPEIRTAGETSIVNMTVATTDVRGSGADKKETVEWHRVTVFGKTAENCAKYLAKGRSVLVEGRLQTRSWDDKEGVKRYTTEIIANGVQFLGGGDKEKKVAQPDNTGPDLPSLDDMEIPF